MKEFRNPQNVHAPLGGYSHHVEITGNERLLVLSGQVGVREDGTVPDDALEQLEVAFENILRNLQAANMDSNDIVKLTYYVVGEMDVAKRRALIASKLQGHKPCSTFLYVAGLASPQYKVEVEALASHSD
ncbi:MAG: RidA family protein [Anaerolineae bacterium]|nr:MAG: RidA family protein [Anaerolineae bacterium]WKZ45422.1 MAG: RidA family protein [Anaerolineales bacterium]